MDADKFTDNCTGRLVRIAVAGGDDWAFIPANLPPDWEFPHHLWPLLAEAREQLGKLDGIGRALKNPALLLTPLQHREALRSSSLEGTYATPVELLLYELDPRRPRSERDRANEWREVANYNEALQYGFKQLKKLPLVLRLIRGMHEVLLEGVRGRDKRPGEFRQTQVHIGSDRRYVPVPPSELQECLRAFEIQLNTDKSRYDPLIRAFLMHYQFEAIHPFRDGNGRVGRVLLSLAICQWKDHHMPWVYLSPFFERYKDEYIHNLFRVSTHGDWDRWVEFCLRGTINQCRDAVRRCELLDHLRDVLHQKADGLSPRMRMLVDRLFVSPVVKVQDVKKWCGVSRPTARADVAKLEAIDVLKPLDKPKKPRIYYSPDILNIAYSEEDEA